MNKIKTVKSALISVFDKEGLDIIIHKLSELGVEIYSTGGTQNYIESLGVHVKAVEDLTGYPSILGGRVKTLHPKVFGGILAMRTDDHLSQIQEYNIPEIDLVIVDLYPFEQTVAEGKSHEEIIEKIDIGGISLIRAAAKNYNDVTVVASKDQYSYLYDVLNEAEGATDIDFRRKMALHAFNVSSHYDTAIFHYLNFGQDTALNNFKKSFSQKSTLRYGENPHQSASYFGALDEVFDKLCGKDLSYNNLVDVDAALQLVYEFKDDKPTFIIIKHTNACGVATRPTVFEAWDAALAGDPVSAFGGILACNTKIDLETAKKINELFYEVLIAPAYDTEALDLLSAKSKRVLLRYKNIEPQNTAYKSLLNGVIVQDSDLNSEAEYSWEVKTKVQPKEEEERDLIFANKCVKHLKSNTIVLVKNNQLLGMGCGQTSRIDACQQAIEKAKAFGFDLEGAVMASDAFFPFPDCVELGHLAGIRAVVQPGGSIKDQLSIDYCDAHGLSMVFTGVRHFKH